MMSLSEGFKSLRKRILPSGAVLSRGRGHFFGERIQMLPPLCLDPREVIGRPTVVQFDFVPHSRSVPRSQNLTCGFAEKRGTKRWRGTE
jgi:hypothetical protein